MKINQSFLSLLALFTSVKKQEQQTANVVDATSIKIDMLPFANVRTDPIFVRNQLSDHVHTFYGGTSARPETTYQDLRNAYGGTTNVEEDQSLYWHPTIYRVDPQTNVKTMAQIYFGSSYYIWTTGQATAFPDGFKMVVFAPLEDTAFPAEAMDELEIPITFPHCWDGVNLDSADHMSHVAFTNNRDIHGTCPSTHPVILPQLIYFVRVAPFLGGPHVFSDNTTRLHVQFISGWNQTHLQGVLDNCTNPSFEAAPDFWCEDFLTFKDLPKFVHPCETLASNLATVAAFQPAPLDTSTITTEIINNVTDLPRGVGTGTLLPRVPGPVATLPPVPTPPPVTLPETCAEEEPAGGEDPVNEPIEDPVDEPSEDPVNEPSEDPVDEPSDEPDNEQTDEPDDEPEEDPADPGDPANSGSIGVFNNQGQSGPGIGVTSDNPVFCFSPNNYVSVLGKNHPVMMNQLKVGDHVQVDHDKYEQVFGFGHYNLEKNNVIYHQIHTNLPNQKPIEISGEHLIFVQQQQQQQQQQQGSQTQKAVPVSTLVVGDNLVTGASSSSDGMTTTAKIVRIETVKRQGMFAPFTKSGTILVNGIRASTFVTLQQDSANVQIIGGLEMPISWNWLGQISQAPHRFACLIDFEYFCQNETYDSESGISLWSKPMFVMTQGMLKKKNDDDFVGRLMGTICLMLMFGVVVLFSILEYVLVDLVKSTSGGTILLISMGGMLLLLLLGKGCFWNNKKGEVKMVA